MSAIGFSPSVRLRWLANISGLSGTAMQVLAIMLHRANAETLLAWPSRSSMCDMTGRDGSTVFDAIHALVDRGLITDTGERRGLTRQVTVWRVNCDVGNDKALGNPNPCEIPTVGNSPPKALGIPNEKDWENPTRTSKGTSKRTGKREARSSSASKRRTGTKLPDDFTVREELITEVMRKQGWSRSTADAEVDKFIHYYTNGKGMNEERRNWDRAFQNWCSQSYAGQQLKKPHQDDTIKMPPPSPIWRNGGFVS